MRSTAKPERPGTCHSRDVLHVPADAWQIFVTKTCYWNVNGIHCISSITATDYIESSCRELCSTTFIGWYIVCRDCRLNQGWTSRSSNSCPMPALHLRRKAAEWRALVQSAEYCLACLEHASKCKPLAFWLQNRSPSAFRRSACAFQSKDPSSRVVLEGIVQT